MKTLRIRYKPGSAMNRSLPVILYGLLSIAWVMLIFGFSMKNGVESSNQSSELTHTILYILSQLGVASVCNITSEEFTRAESIIRTLGHFLEFTVLGVLAENLIHRLIRYSSHESRSRNPEYLLAAAACLAVAITDEIIQIGSPGRAFQILDIAVDMAGAAVGILAARFLLSRVRRGKPSDSQEIS
ncbi:MAG: VanZ family protein [Saccharofermentanales bacterium]